MGTYRMISPSFWTDRKIDEDFTPEDKYFYLYLLTNPHTNICGCYEVGLKQMAYETGYNTDTVKRLIERMENTHGVIKYSTSHKEILLLNWGRFNWSTSDKLIKAVENVSSQIKSSTFKKYILDQLDEKRNSKKESTKERITETDTDTDTDTATATDVSIGYGYPIDTLSEEEKKSELMKLSPNQVVSLYNEVCRGFPKVRTPISESRRNAIIARLNKYQTQDFKELFIKAQASDFLKGNNNNNWRADFDWLMNGRNFERVLEGKYDNRDGIASNPLVQEFQSMKQKTQEGGF